MRSPSSSWLVARSVRSNLGTSDSPCYLALPAATRSVGATSRLVGVHLTTVRTIAKDSSLPGQGARHRERLRQTGLRIRVRRSIQQVLGFEGTRTHLRTVCRGGTDQPWEQAPGDGHSATPTLAIRTPSLRVNYPENQDRPALRRQREVPRRQFRIHLRSVAALLLDPGRR